MPRTQRAWDLLGATAGLIAFGPVMAAIAVAIALDDGGPVLFAQERVGFRRTTFRILKFRSMRDGRITRVGRAIRATGLDELPQFLNILRGDMSATGPRPLTADDVERFGWLEPEFDFRWDCRPGLTGLAQLLGALVHGDVLACDAVHARGWRLALDCEIVAWSVLVNVCGKARVRPWARARFTRAIAVRPAPAGSPRPAALTASITLRDRTSR